MDVLVESVGPDGADALQEFDKELLNDARWRGRVALVERPAPPGTLGPVLEAVRIALEPQTLALLVTAVISYLRYRTTDLDLKIVRTDSKTEVVLSGRRIKGHDHAALARELADAVSRLEPPDADDPQP
ncbi:effector-associated constant component EACC1 [Nocardia suismassiliense]|uniref:effector-associated constant component EACC1 n=1 Tax=Nocardia suismassiliense TaxID=2077092 RepID=UPI000D1FC9D1|nr:hypothetical protein [Nocardia suismassiliense]